MDNYINDFFKTKLTIKSFCKQNNLDIETFSDRLEELGYIISSRQSGETIYKIKSAISEYKNSKRTCGQVARKFNIASYTLKKVLEELHILDITRTTRKYNEHIFDNIDSEDKAYWLGYIYADGYIYNLKPRKNGQLDYNFELCSKGDDYNHMKKFADFIEYEGELKIVKADAKGHTRCRVCLYSKHLWNTLNDYGCTPNKSLTLMFPNESIFANKDLIRHFIRGYFDGDGCLSYYNKEHTEVSIQLLGTQQFLSKVLYYLNIDTKLYHNHDNVEESTMQIRLASRKGFNFINKLYQNCNVYLQRKYERYCYFCPLYK